jgi:DNA topoisomerase IB
VARLRRVDCSSPGIRRRRRGSGFSYHHPDGTPVVDLETLERIRSLAIPPAWTDVWICNAPNGHLQAVGTDAAGRRQYLYHPRWRERRDQEKFDRMVAFAQSLPKVRAVTARDLRADGLTRERVLACAVRLLDRGYFRVGGEEYADENGSYGLATLEKRHVAFENGALLFDYVAKGGKRAVHAVTDPEAAEVLQVLKRRRGGGPSLLAYRNGRWVDVQSGDINAYIKEIAGPDYSAKDFRTWHATVLAASALARGAIATSKTARRRAIAAAAEEAAERLGNTAAVSLSSYIDPRVIDRYVAGTTIAKELVGDGKSDLHGRALKRIEAAVLDLLA